MYERMLDKAIEPTAGQIEEYLGADEYKRLLRLEERLRASYHLESALRFPFGSSYGWGYKYSHKSAHLCYAFFEKGAFTVTLQIGDRQAPALEDMLAGLSPRAQALWASRYPCGEHGGWVHYRVLDDDALHDIMKLLAVRKKPVKAKQA